MNIKDYLKIIMSEKSLTKDLIHLFHFDKILENANYTNKKESNCCLGTGRQREAGKGITKMHE